MPNAQLPFWSDDFDTDLPKVIPDWLDILGDTHDVVLWTNSHTSHGRINGPAAWDTHEGLTSFFGFDERCGTPAGYVSHPHGPVQCTFAEVVRDLWVHQVHGRVEGKLVIVPPSWSLFAGIMYHIRGETDIATKDIVGDKYRVRCWIANCSAAMSAAARAHGLMPVTAP